MQKIDLDLSPLQRFLSDVKKALLTKKITHMIKMYQHTHFLVSVKLFSDFRRYLRTDDYLSVIR